MAPFALGLALAAALLHALWNLLIKASNDRLVGSWALMCLGALVFLPFLIVYGIPSRALGYALVSSLVETAYLLSLIAAYEHGDLSATYPVARGVAPALITVLGAVFLADRLEALQLVAVGLVTIGVIMVAARRLPTAGLRWALLTGVLIAIYTSIDAAAVRASGESFRYSVVLFTLTSLFITPLVMLRRRRGEVASLLRAEWMRLLVAGAASLGAYSLVLVAARQAPVGAVAAVREISVLFGALGGWWALKEKLAVRGLAGAVVIVAGVVGLALL